MATALVTDPGLTVTTFPSHTVEVQTDLRANAWAVVPHVYCNELTFATNAHNRAELQYEIGAEVLQIGEATYADCQPLTLKGKFVRITLIDAVNGDRTWVGYVLDDEIARDGVKAVAGVNKLVGATQFFKCVGLEYFLDRRQIDSSVVRKNGADPNWIRIYRPLVFNGGPTSLLDATTGKRENRSPDENDDEQYDFADDFDAAELWTAGWIVEHLLQYHTMLAKPDPPDPAEPMPALYRIDGTTTMLDGFKPTLRSEGQTVFALLNELANPQRGLCWWCEFDDHLGLSDNEIIVRFASSAGSLVSLPGGGDLPANTDQITLDFDSELDVASVRIRDLGSRQYQQVVARGARQTATLTVGFGDETLEEDWTNDDEAAYQAAARDGTDDTAYDALPESDKKNRNDAYRKSDLLYRPFAAFRISRSWDGKSYDGSDAGEDRDWAMADLYPNGTIRGGQGFHCQGLKLLNLTRLKLGWDYTDADAPVDNSPPNSAPEFMPPLAVVRVATDPDRWQLVDKMSETHFAAGTEVSSDIHTSYSLRMQQTVPGFVLKAHGHQHAMALNHWTSAEPSAGQPEVDYLDLRATVCCEADFFCEGKYPLDDDLPEDVPLEVLHLDAGEFHRLDFLAKGTIVNVTGGELVRADEAVVLRDDRQYLEDVARLAFEWYQTQRQQLTVTFRQLANKFDLGQLVTTIGSGTTAQNINTVVSHIRYDLKHGTLTVETADATLDVRSMVA